MNKIGNNRKKLDEAARILKARPRHDLSLGECGVMAEELKLSGLVCSASTPVCTKNSDSNVEVMKSTEESM